MQGFDRVSESDECPKKDVPFLRCSRNNEGKMSAGILGIYFSTCFQAKSTFEFGSSLVPQPDNLSFRKLMNKGGGTCPNRNSSFHLCSIRH